MNRFFVLSSLIVLLTAAPAVAADQSSQDSMLAAQNVDAAYQGGGGGTPADTAALEQQAQAGLQQQGQQPAAERTPVAAAPQPEEAAPAKAAPAYTKEDQPFKLRDYEEPKAAPPAPWWQQALGFVFKLGIVIGLIFASLGLIKKFSGGRISLPSAKGRNLAVLESLQLGPQQSVHVVSLGGERLLVLGTSPQGVSTLAEITDPQQLKPFLNPGRGNATPFNQLYDMESVGTDHPQDLFTDAMRQVGGLDIKTTGWPKS